MISGPPSVEKERHQIGSIHERRGDSGFERVECTSQLGSEVRAGVAWMILSSSASAALHTGRRLRLQAASGNTFCIHKGWRNFVANLS